MSSTVDSRLEVMLHLALVNALASALPTVHLQHVGMTQEETTLDDLEEWIVPFLITVNRQAARRNDYLAPCLFQVSCVSKFAEERADRLTNAPMLLAGKVRNALDQQDIAVVDDESGGVVVAIAEVAEGSISYVGDTSSTLSAGNTINNSAHGAVVTFPLYLVKED